MCSNKRVYIKLFLYKSYDNNNYDIDLNESNQIQFK